MKKHITYYALLLLCAGIGACSKRQNGTPFTGTMSASVGTSQFSTSSASVNCTSTYPLRIRINGSCNAGVISLVVAPYTGVGTYSVTSADGTSFAGSNQISNTGISGQINVTDSYSYGDNVTVIKGTFKFNTDNHDSIYNGQFSVPLVLN